MLELHKRSTNAWFGSNRDDIVATSVARTHPDKAIAIWKKIAEGLIAQTKVGAYGDAVAYLRKARKAMDDVGGADAWAVYLAALTEANKRKSRLVEMLNVLSGKPIISK